MATSGVPDGPEARASPPSPARPGAMSALLRDLVAQPERGDGWEGVLRPGAVVGRFELVRELGRGGFGVVYEARDRELLRTVAFKALRSVGPPAADEERLLAEAESAARLSHPNIVTLYDLGRTAHGPYLVLELLRGETLARRLEQGRLPFLEAIRIACEVSKGIAHAHARGVVHRDLSPGNVFLCADGQVKILDLGLSCAFGRRGLPGGTRAYMAPEQRRGAPEDERTDVFALGALTYRMVAGDLPFPDGALTGPAPALDTPANPAVGELVARMLDLDPVRRPRDAGPVSAALAAFVRELERAPAAGAPAAARVRRRRPWRVPAVLSAGALALAGVALLATRHLLPGRPVAEVFPSIAVLPFEDLSPQHDQQYFADGLAEEILNALVQIKGLHVAGRTSSFSLRGEGEDIRNVASRLHVGAVLEGSVRKSGNRVRVTAQIVGGADGYELWSRSYDREVADIFAVQDDIARAVVQALRVNLLSGPTPPPIGHRTPSAEAYEQVLLGRSLRKQYSDEGFRQARRAFERAVELDPSYAPAWAGLAGTVGATTWDAADRRAAEDEALVLADKAVSLDPTLVEAWTTRGALRSDVWDWDGAQADLERALALGPGDADGQRRFGMLQSRLGRTQDALTAAERAVELDPISAASWDALAWVQASDGRLEDARASASCAAQLAPGAHGPLFTVAFVALRQGRPSAALEVAPMLTEELGRMIITAMAQHDLGRPAESQRALDEARVKYGADHPVAIAAIYSWRGELDEAFDWLDRGYARHDDLLPNLKDGPFFGNLRRDPRYHVLLRRLGLPVD